MKKKEEMPLRLGVGIVLLNDNNEVFVGKRIDNPKDFWQMPQGGVDKNENFLSAAKRELEEETSIKNVKLIKEIEGWLTYDLPENLLGKNPLRYSDGFRVFCPPNACCNSRYQSNNPILSSFPDHRMYVVPNAGLPAAILHFLNIQVCPSIQSGCHS